MKPFNYDKMDKLIKDNPFLEYLFEESYLLYDTYEDCYKDIYECIVGNKYYETQYNNLFN